MNAPIHRRSRVSNLARWATLLTITGFLTSSSPLQAEDRTMHFAGQTWNVRKGHGGPGPNRWSDGKESVWVDDQGRLHLRIRQIAGEWSCAEVWTQKSLGYGDYVFQLASNVEKNDPNVVVGLFTYLDDRHEIDIEFSRWGKARSEPAQYVIQPGSRPGNVRRFALGLTGDSSTHRFHWREGSVFFQSLHGHYDTLSSKTMLIQEWKTMSPDIPRAGAEKLHINLWLDRGRPPADGKDVEVIINSFRWQKG
jgi:hypothetical protein